MDVFVVVRILLEYGGTIEDWSNARTLNRTIKLIVQNQQYDYDVVGARSFISVNRCMVCNKHADNAKWLVHKGLPLSMRQYTVTCRHYKCRVSSLFSMFSELSHHNIYMLKKPFQKSTQIKIPRSDGSETDGICVVYSLILIKGTPCIMTQWDDYIKNVPWSHYFVKEPDFIFKDM